ncbi:hypothetical protein [Pseudoroseicyclus tamaricis]|uniref:Lipopolysaccharide export system protein LptC n=1 Tax=Pseudoroseicyclus tamaricis TaxID=2705421 RepID=A0A6B2JMM5_9RHOB|nr:hypothetical protein [Pseudoroseicyclus tamaricis]NDV02841.1 hypothetical protein [Pseudoroseicyclus tamaricis]
MARRPIRPAADNPYSVFVSWSKIVLPLIALGLLSTLFLFTRREEPVSVPVAELEEIAREQRLANPSYAGVATDGSAIAIAAEEISPDGEERFAILRPRAQIDAADGTGMRISAGAGTLDVPGNSAELRGLARLVTTNGYAMETEGVTADLASGRVESTGRLAVRAPFGELEAGRMAYGGTDAGKLIFSEGVRLLYDPPDDAAAPADPAPQTAAPEEE